MGRFLNADTLVNICQGFVGHNVFAYCGNNPIIYKDTGGNAIETVFDIISLGASIAEVAINPTDPWAWASLVGDALDVAIPFVGGTGELVRGFKAVAEGVRIANSGKALLELTGATLDSVKQAAQSLPKGNTSVYVSYKNDTLEYVGITNSFNRRRAEWRKTREITELIPNLDRKSARLVEQTLISTFGKGEYGVLSNKINSIGKKSSILDDFADFFRKLF